MRRISLVLLVATASCSSPKPPPPAAPAPAPAATAPNAPTERTPAQLERDRELGQRAAAVIDAFSNRIGGFAGQLTPDGDLLVFGSNRDGSPQLYVGRADAPSEPPRRLTEGPERVQTAVLTRTGDAVLFTRDRGADENSHVFRVGLDGSEPVELTPGEGVRYDPPILPLRKPELMVFGRRTVKSPASTILVGSIAGGEPRAVYEDPAPAFVTDAAPDGTRALLARVLSTSEIVVLELDLEKGATRRLWPAEGRKELVTAATYSLDGRSAYVATDQGGETTAVVALDLRSGEVKARWSPEPATALVDQVIASPRGKVVAVRVSPGNRDELRLLDARTLREKARPEVPLGSLTLGEFTPDGRRLTLSMSTPDRPGEPFVLDVASGELRALRADPRPTLETLTPVEVSITSVKAFDGQPIPVHAYLPRERGDGRLPVIVHFHGGPAASSTIGWNTWAQFFAGLGYAWVEPNVRGSTGFGRAWEMADNREKRGDVLEDMQSVNAWVRAQPWADPDRVVVLGGSYGGWVVLMALTRQPQLWSAGVDLVGVADLRTLLRSTDQLIRAIFVEEFGDLEKDAQLLADWSPLAGAERIEAPLFVYQGENDPRVPRAESDAIVMALRARGLPVEYFIAPDEGHSLDRRENQIAFLARSARFLEEHLR